MGESRVLRCGKGEARTQTGIALSSLVPGKRRGLTWTVAGPPKHLAQEGRLVGGGQRELSVTQLLAQAAMQQAQHHVIGGTWPLGGRDALWLCPSLLAASCPGSSLGGGSGLSTTRPCTGLFCHTGLGAVTWAQKL